MVECHHAVHKSRKNLRVEPNQAAVRDSCQSVQEAVVGQRPEQDCKVNQAQPASCQARPAKAIDVVSQLYAVTQ